MLLNVKFVGFLIVVDDMTTLYVNVFVLKVFNVYVLLVRVYVVGLEMFVFIVMLSISVLLILVYVLLYVFEFVCLMLVAFGRT